MARTRTSRRRSGPWARILHSPTGVVGLVLVAAIVLAALIGPILHTIDPTAIHPERRLEGPSADFLLGTDQLGRDVLARLMAGARLSLGVGVGAVLIAVVVGGSFGVLAGFIGGWFDDLVMRLMDVLLAFPAILLALLTVAVLGPSTWTVVLAIGLVYVPAMARITRAPVMGLVMEPFIGILRVSGARPLRILVRHVIPNVLPPVMVQATISLSYAILIEASLSYLGLGVQPPDPSWGSMISEAQKYLTTESQLLLFPCLALALTICGFNLLGDATRDVMDPRMAGRR